MKDKKHNPFLRILNNRKGVSAILIAIILPVLIGFAALAIDVGYMYATKNELQNIADGAALAGAGELGRIYLELDQEFHSTYVVVPESEDEERIKSAARDVAALNDAAGLSITIDDSEIFIGEWNFNSRSFEEGMEVPLEIHSAPAVRVFARRDSSEFGNGAVATFFARIFSFFGGSHDTFESSAVATAALSGMSITDEGVIKAPFGISENHDCYVHGVADGIVKFYPTPDSCAGWHNFFDASNASNIKERFISFIEGYETKESPAEGQNWIDAHYSGLNKPYPSDLSPEVRIHDELEYSGGTINSLFSTGVYYEQWTSENSPVDISTNNPNNYTSLNPFKNLFDFFRFRDGDGSGPDTVDFCGENVLADEVWSTVVPVYKDNIDGTCSNPSGLIETVSFALVQIRMTFDPDFPFDPVKADVDVCYICPANVEAGRGGGGTFGNVIASIPNLVE